jgi:hypothetical protein
MYEYARRQFKTVEGVASALGIDADSQRALRLSGKDLSPRRGGRHIDKPNASPPWNLDEVRAHVSLMIRAWVIHSEPLNCPPMTQVLHES